MTGTLSFGDVFAWHDRSPAEHASLTAQWSALGFRTASLALYGTPASLRYAAVMIRRPAVITERQVGPLGLAGMQHQLDVMAQAGFAPYALTATGATGSAQFAAAFAPASDARLTRLDLTPPELVTEDGAQRQAGAVLRSVDAYGTAADTRYAAIWTANAAGEAWGLGATRDADSALPVAEDEAAFRARLDALAATRCRAAHVAVTPDGRYAGAFVDSVVGPTEARVGMTSAGYQAAHASATARALVPVRVSAEGAGAGARFAAIFASRETPAPRVFRTTGPVAVAAVDDAMEAFVRAHGLRGAALAIVKGTRLVYARGYTFAEPAPAYPDVLPTTRFRQASVSKLFTAIAAWRLMQIDPGFGLHTTLQALLDLTQPDGSPPADPRFEAITIRHLLESTSGIRQELIWAAKAAAAAVGAPLPATLEQIARHVAAQTLTGMPGTPTNVSYGNTDYALLGLAIAARTGAASFEEALRALVLAPLAMTRTRASRSPVGAQAADEARYHLRDLPLAEDLMRPGGLRAPAQYRGDYEILGGSGGLSAAVVDVARLVAMLSLRVGNPVLSRTTLDRLFAAAATATATLRYEPPPGTPGDQGRRVQGFHGFDGATLVAGSPPVLRASKGGLVPGAASAAVVRTGASGYSFVLSQNVDPLRGGPDWLAPVEAAATNHSWPAGDLFPTYGMGRLVRRRNIDP